MDIFNKFTSHYKKSIMGAYGLSLAENKKQIGIEELFWALLSEKGSLGQETLVKAGVKTQQRSNNQLAQKTISLERILKSKEVIPLSEEVKRVLIDSAKLSAKYGHNYVGTEHLLYSLIKLNSKAINQIFKEYKVNVKDLIANLDMILNSTSKFSDMTDVVSSLKQKIKEQKKSTRKRDSLLESFATHLTDELVQKNINPVVGRLDEINRVIQILSRRDKNNPILLGEPGVGKTAIVEGMAKKIMEADVPDVLINKKIYALDMPLLVAGTSFRGEFEARIKQIVDEVKADKNIILFIDEIHNIIGAGSASGTMDAANILKPALARGEIRCIGATTYDDYKKIIEPDSALTRRMQKVIVREPSREESIKILKGVRKSYEQHHLITITDEAIEEAVNLSVRYLTDQFLPDKAIDLIDEAASKKRVNRPRNKNIQKIADMQKELMGIKQQKKSLVDQAKYSQALKLRPKELELTSRIFKLEDEEIKNKMEINPQLANYDKITASDIREVVSETTKINIPDSQESGEIIKNLAGNLKAKIVGQDKVIAKLANALKRSAAGLAGEKRPLGSFIFAGPSGVGKTYTAKILAESISPGRESLIKFDMSEFGEKFNASKLIGAPAGYVGYEEGGQLTEKVKRNPYAVILLDEIEKAHQDIFNLFLQIFEDGYLTDSKGRQVNFRNTIIIMTTNIGLKKNTEKAAMGFGDENKEKIENLFKERLREWMRPELLNRIDQILVFNELNGDDLAKIIDMEMKNINNNLAGRQMSIKWNKATVNYLLKKCGAKKDEGARIIREVLREEVENKLAEKILDTKTKRGQINIKINANKLLFEQS